MTQNFEHYHATSMMQVSLAFLVALSGGGATAVDDHQKIRASLITRPVGDKRVNLRITLQRTVWRTDGTVSANHSVEDPELYREFFNRLSKAVFLHANEI